MLEQAFPEGSGQRVDNRSRRPRRLYKDLHLDCRLRRPESYLLDHRDMPPGWTLSSPRTSSQDRGTVRYTLPEGIEPPPHGSKPCILSVILRKQDQMIVEPPAGDHHVDPLFRLITVPRRPDSTILHGWSGKYNLPQKGVAPPRPLQTPASKTGVSTVPPLGR